ncbi:hypothetical protein HDU98_006507 [Podochytrium sp. JEL0797]|nr:hypothetical protein HDU98_006507 [Podochytrium sp. JEL0797]
MLYSFGIYNSYYLDLLHARAFEVALIGSVGISSLTAVGVLSGFLTERYGSRPTIIIGTIILSLGLLLASFTTSIPLLILTQGLILPSQYFDKTRGLATGIAVAGTGCGGLVFSVITEQMLTRIGLAWTLRASAIICFTSLLLVIPLMKSRIPSTFDPSNPEKESTNKKRAFLKNPIFYFLCLSCFLSNWLSVIPMNYIPVFAQNSVGVSLHGQSNILAVYNAFNILGRIVMGFTSDLFGPLNSLVMSMSITVAAVFWWLGVSTYSELMGFGAVNGFFDGAFWGLFPVVVASVFGADENLTSMIGIIYALCAFGVASAPIAGWLEQSYGFREMIVYTGCVSVVAAGFGLAARLSVSRIFLKKI